ncbi:MAG: hypothetical protein QXE01_06775 [Sulfolobales archaeon]
MSILRGDLVDCIDNLIEIFERARDILIEQQWFPEDPMSMRWWGGLETPLEIMITAILVKLSKWSSALKALENMRLEGLVDLERLAKTDPERLAKTIKGVGFPRSKARTIVELAKYIASNGGIDKIAGKETNILRRELMGIDGIGRETADSILLFALNKPIFPIARLSIRVLKRFCGEELGGYEDMRREIEEIVNRDLYRLKLLHAGLVTIASRYCRNRHPRCGECPLRDKCLYSRTVIRSNPSTA